MAKSKNKAGEDWWGVAYKFSYARNPKLAREAVELAQLKKVDPKTVVAKWLEAGIHTPARAYLWRSFFAAPPGENLSKQWSDELEEIRKVAKRWR